MIVELDNIELSFDSKSILHGVYLKGETGRITGILGTNGAGKSSLLHILFGQLEPQRKLLKIDSQPILKPLFSSGMVKLLPQQNLIPGQLKLRQAFQLYKVSWAGFTSIFPGFEKYERAGVQELSGGERRMVEIYLSIKSDSKIILLDEPFSHLSPVNIEKTKELILEAGKDKVVILTDHMFRDVISVADDLYLLKNGCSKLITDLKQLENYRYLNPDML